MWLDISETTYYGKCSKVLKTFLFLFSNNMLIIRARIPKMFVRLVNREDPDQTCSEAVWPESVLFIGLGLFGRQLVFKILEHLPFSKLQNHMKLVALTPTTSQ